MGRRGSKQSFDSLLFFEEICIAQNTVAVQKTYRLRKLQNVGQLRQLSPGIVFVGLNLQADYISCVEMGYTEKAGASLGS